RMGGGPSAPHDPPTADIAGLVGSVDLSKVSEFGDEGDPRAWSWSGSVFAASRGMLEMIEILKVKREFLYLLLTLTQEKNVKVSRFPLIYLDETVVAHTNLAEFRKFLQEAENEALLDRVVIIQVPYTLSYKEDARAQPGRRALGRVAALRDQCAVKRHHPVAREKPDHDGRAARAERRHRVRRAHRRQEEAQVGRFPGDGAQGLLQPLGQGGRAQ